MEKDKILKVLEEVSSGTKLYSTTFGKLEFNGMVASTDGPKIELATKNQECITYFPDGRYRKEGEVTLYPSKEMRNWDKFSWKKGNVLKHNSEKTLVLFEGFADDTYTEFFGKYFREYAIINSNKNKKLKTKDYFACPRIAKEYIDLIERTFDGKLNLETLEIEKNKFKDGDILVLNDRSPFILKGEATYGYSYYVGIGDMGSLCISTGNTWCGKHENVRYATEAEKMKLFDVLTIEGKRWNAEKKIVEDIKQVPKRSSPIHKKKSDPPEHVFEPFEKVLVRDDDTRKWTIDLFEREDLTGDGDYKYVCLVSAWKYCIHYKGNEHLLDTTNNQD